MGLHFPIGCTPMSIFNFNINQCLSWMHYTTYHISFIVKTFLKQVLFNIIKLLKFYSLLLIFTIMMPSTWQIAWFKKIQNHVRYIVLSMLIDENESWVELHSDNKDSSWVLMFKIEVVKGLTCIVQWLKVARIC
jgi:hypothetical protein